MEQPSAGARHFVSQGPSCRWMLGFCSLLALGSSPRWPSPTSGIETVRGKQPRRLGRVGGDRPERPWLRGVPRADADPRILQRTGGSLSSIAVLSLSSGDVGGSLLLRVPRDPGRGPGGLDEPRSRAVVAFGLDPSKAMRSLQAQLGFGITEVAVVDDTRWAELVAPVAPLSSTTPRPAVGSPPADHPHGGPGGPVPRRPRRWRARARGRPAAAVLPSLVGAVAASTTPPGPRRGRLGIGASCEGWPVGLTTSISAGARDRSGENGASTSMPTRWRRRRTLVPFPTAGQPGGRPCPPAGRHRRSEHVQESPRRSCRPSRDRRRRQRRRLRLRRDRDPLPPPALKAAASAFGRAWARAG